MKIKYQCEICGNVYDDKKSAEECESYGIDEPLLNIGDIITICDCKKTPIMFIKYRDVYPRYEYERCVPNGNILYYIEKVCNRKIKCKLAFIEKSSPHSLRYVFYPVEEEFQFFRIEMQQYQLKNQLKYYNKIESEEFKMEKDIHDKKWYKNRIDELEDWLFDKKICNADNPIEKEAYECVLHKVIDMFDIMDDEDAENLLRSLDEWDKWE